MELGWYTLDVCSSKVACSSHCHLLFSLVLIYIHIYIYILLITYLVIYIYQQNKEEGVCFYPVISMYIYLYYLQVFIKCMYYLSVFTFTYKYRACLFLDSEGMSTYFGWGTFLEKRAFSNSLAIIFNHL